MAAISSYRNYESEARDLVHSLLVTCLKEVSKEDIALQEDVQWPPADQFTVESGKSCIEQLIKVNFVKSSLSSLSCRAGT